MKMKGRERTTLLKLSALALLMGACVFAWGKTPVSEASVIESVEPGGTSVEENNYAILDYSNTDKGYVNVKYVESTSKKTMVSVVGPKNTYYYNLAKGKYEVYPLTDGNGEYKVSVLRQKDNAGHYTVALAKSFAVKLQNEFQPYIRANQYVNYKAGTKCVKKADSLCRKAKTDLAKVKKVYKFVIKYFKYDKAKAKTVKGGYVPNLDTIYKKKKGICFDYAATMSAMLRSQGVPVKLVIGYTGKEYHAWVNIYSKKKGWIMGAIYIAGNKWKLMDPTFASTANSSASIIKYINNTKNYKAMYSY